MIKNVFCVNVIKNDNFFDVLKIDFVDVEVFDFENFVKFVNYFFFFLRCWMKTMFRKPVQLIKQKIFSSLFFWLSEKKNFSILLDLFWSFFFSKMTLFITNNMIVFTQRAFCSNWKNLTFRFFMIRFIASITFDNWKTLIFDIIVRSTIETLLYVWITM